MNLKNVHIRKNIRQFPHLGKLSPYTLLLSPHTRRQQNGILGNRQEPVPQHQA